ncbi:hypothetical protein FRC03_005130 [Tulasnella sp. 419]|nr:hypothetical protein FRC03_005130 [Tulasnella sp. 419]
MAGFNFPKVHSLLHYVRAIKAFGTTDGYNTESTERLHIDMVKDAYRASNKRDYMPQMVEWLERKERIKKFALMIEWVEESNLPGEADTNPSLRSLIHLSIHPTIRKVPIDNLKKDYGAIHFPAALGVYLRQYWNRLDHVPTITKSAGSIPLENTPVPVWHHVKFSHFNVQGLDFIEDTSDAVHVYPTQQSKRKDDTIRARFDTVLINEKGEAEITGVAGE